MRKNNFFFNLIKIMSLNDQIRYIEDRNMIIRYINNLIRNFQLCSYIFAKEYNPTPIKFLFTVG